jgi:hypothetical protein
MLKVARNIPEIERNDSFDTGSKLEGVVCDLKGQAAVLRVALDHADRSMVEDADRIDGLERLADEIYCNAKKAHDLYYEQFDQLMAEKKKREAAKV